MITFNYLSDFQLKDIRKVKNWISQSIGLEEFKEGDIDYIFCSDNYLVEINSKYLKHNTLTDIVSFDYTVGRLISGDIFISVERVSENAIKYNVSFSNELQRVMIHGILHLCGYNDKTKIERQLMRSKEDYYLSLLNL